ncbi:hypothetical protein ES703_58695 [subsurface metagenome]
MKKFIIPLLTVVMVVSIILAGCAPAPPTPPTAPTTPGPAEQPPEAPPPPPPAPALPKPGEWNAATGATEFEFTSFTVSPDSTGIPEMSYSFREFKCGPTTVTAPGATIKRSPPWPITGGQFTIDWVERMEYGPDWDIVIQGKFDETGTQASGTWEISAEGTICQEGTWEASAP